MRLIPILPRGKVFDASKLQAQIDAGLDKAAAGVTVDFKKTVKTWKGKPKFVTEKRKDERVISAKNRIYFFISGGTKVRYATMTPNFQAKTAPGRFQAKKGAGGLGYVDKRKPRPGIKARQFDRQLAKIWEDKLPKYIQMEIK